MALITFRFPWGENKAAPVKDFMKYLGFNGPDMTKNFAEFRQLAEGTRFLRTNNRPEVEIKFEKGNECNLNAAEVLLGPLVQQKRTIRKIEQFLRLQRALGWRMSELDQAVTTFGPAWDKPGPGKKSNKQLSMEEFLVKISHVQRLHDDLELPVVDLLSWWGNIETSSLSPAGLNGNHHVPSLYERTFLNKSVNNPPLPAFQLQNDSQIVGATIDDKNFEDVLLGVLNLTAGDLRILLHEVLPTHSKTPEPNKKTVTWTIETLSQLYRHVTFANLVGISIQEFLTLKVLLPVKPFDSTHTQQTLDFIDLVKIIRESPFSISELAYFFGKEAPWDSSLTPSTAEQQRVLERIQQALRVAVRQQEEAKGEDSKSSDHSPQLEEVVSQELSSALRLQSDIVKLLLEEEAIRPTQDKGSEKPKETLMPVFLKLAQANVPSLKPVNETDDHAKISDGKFADVRDAFLALHRVSLVLTRMELSLEEVRYLLGHDSPLDLRTFLSASSDALAQWNAFWDWWNLVQFRNRYHHEDISLIGLFAERDESSSMSAEGKDQAVTNGTGKAPPLKERLLKLTGWNHENFETVVRLLDNPGKLFNSKQILNGPRLLFVHEAFRLLKRLGISGQQFKQFLEIDLWGEQSNPDQKTGQLVLTLKHVMKAKYGEAHWLEVIRPLQGMLRNKKREALVTFLTYFPSPVLKEQMRTSNDVYDMLLFDVEMDACMMTSRLKLAIGSVQLFIQRILMNLEPPLKFSDQEAREWVWRKNYRVWEANRKVFLYPENWIEPELRDDKSPFFQELEDELSQNEITDETAERAVKKYLYKLDEVANLEIMGMYQDEDVNVLHVFGRTHGTPHIYYYRRWENKDTWTPWEKVDLDIEGDHLIPVIWNRRLHLFWPLFREKTVQVKEMPSPTFKESTNANGEKTFHSAKEKQQFPAKYWEISLAYSELANGKWSARKETSVPWKVIPSSKRYWFAYWGKQEELLTFVKDLGNSWPIKKNYITFKALKSRDSLSIRGYILTPRYAEGPGELKASMIPAAEFSFSTDGKNVNLIKGYNSLIGSRQLLWIPPPLTISGMQQEITTKNRDIKTFGLTLPFFLPAGIIKWQLREDYLLDEKLLAYYRLIRLDRNVLKINSHAFKDFVPIESLLNFRIQFPHQELQFDAHQQPFFIINSNHSFFVRYGVIGQFTIKVPAFSKLEPELEGAERVYGYKFQPSYHPYTSYFLREINREGLSALYQPHSTSSSTDVVVERRQTINETKKTKYQDKYQVNKQLTRLPQEDIEFDRKETYASYNWELFFHIPFLIATRLSQNQKYEEALRWFHYIFDPTEHEGERTPDRYWKFRPFYEYTGDSEKLKRRRIQDLMKLLNRGDERLKRQWEELQRKPFHPHVVARQRFWAYPKAVAMKYLDTLLAWGDQLFRRDTIESINEATQLYIIAAKLLGDRPAEIPRAERQSQTFTDLRADSGFGSFGNRMIENVLAASSSYETSSPQTIGAYDYALPEGSLYFCVPNNDQLTRYWDLVEDRLFKVRHCMNIEGQVRQLPLFQPPIDPGMLVRAAAAGVDLASMISDSSGRLPHYRFSVMLQKAKELCGEVRALGGALLSALEKRDAEELSRIRATQEVQVLQSVREIRKMQIDEAKQSMEGLLKTKELTQQRRDYYRDIKKIIPNEKAQMDLLTSAHIINQASQVLSSGISAAYAAPDVDAGASGWGSTPVAKARFGGSNIGAALKAASLYKDLISAELSHQATMASIKGGYDRRWDDWKQQENLAKKELEQIEKQIAAAQIRQALAERELTNHEQQIEHAQKNREFLERKFTNKELYQWMVGQLSTLHFQTYQMAYDLAKQTEKSLKHELSQLAGKSFVQFGHWDSLKKGLLAGEKLAFDLNRMDVAHLENNHRDHELTKHISLTLLDPQALLDLREKGECFVSLPEAVFDIDHPGHYNRRIKSVGLTLPAVTGPYTSVNCHLTLMSHRIRKVTEPYDPNLPLETKFSGLSSIITSHAREDYGMFEPNLRDERYLPFEGAGAVSTWKLELPTKPFRQFDYHSIADVIFHIRYTAQDDGDLKTVVVQELIDNLKTMKLGEEGSERHGLYRFISVRHDFPDEWAKFLNSSGKVTEQIPITVRPTNMHFPHFVQQHNISIESVEGITKSKNSLALPSIKDSDVTLVQPAKNDKRLVQESMEPIEIVATLEASKAKDYEDVGFVIRYNVHPPK